MKQAVQAIFHQGHTRKKQMFSSRTQCFNYSQLEIGAYLLTLVKCCFILSKFIELRLQSIVKQTCRDMICTMSNHLIFFWL